MKPLLSVLTVLAVLGCARKKEEDLRTKPNTEPQKSSTPSPGSSSSAKKPAPALNPVIVTNGKISMRSDYSNTDNTIWEFKVDEVNAVGVNAEKLVGVISAPKFNVIAGNAPLGCESKILGIEFDYVRSLMRIKVANNLSPDESLACDVFGDSIVPKGISLELVKPTHTANGTSAALTQNVMLKFHI